MFHKNLNKENQTDVQGEVVDLFCGVGALSYGFKKAGYKIVAGYDIDPKCKYAFETNNQSTFFERDVGTIDGRKVGQHFSKSGVPSVLIGCAPCQPYSPYRLRYGEHPQWNLVEKFAEIAISADPDYISMENVPGLLNYKDGSVFENFKKILKKKEYKIEANIVNCEDFGVPQSRRRLVVIASRKNYTVSALPIPKIKSVKTVRKAIGALPKLSAGQIDPKDNLHWASSLSPKNIKRIQASKPGGNWKDWPPELLADCHKRNSGKSYLCVYGRMEWDKPSPTITTQCYGYGNGRFGHPQQDRAITLREAATLQSFPKNYKFLPDEEKPVKNMVARWIGNAVPVNLAEAIAQHINNIQLNVEN